MNEAAQLDEIRFACRGIRLVDPIKIWSHSVQRSGLGDRKKYGPLVIFRRKLAKIGDFTNGNEILRVKEAAQLDEIWCACRSICLLDSLKIWRHLVKGSRRGDREKSGFLLIFSRKWGKSVISHTETLI